MESDEIVSDQKSNEGFMLFIQRHVYQVSTFFGKKSVHMPESDESAWQRMGTS